MPKVKSNFVSDLIRQHVTGTLPRLKRFGDGAASIADMLAEAGRICWSFNQRREVIEADARLTGEGKLDALRAAGKETLATLESWHKPLREGLERHEKQLKEEIRAAVIHSPSKDLGDRLEASLLRSEIRKSVAGMTGTQLEVLYREGDGTVRRALEEVKNVSVKNGAVRVVPFPSEKLVAEVLHSDGRQALPETAENFDDLEEIGAIYGQVAIAIKNEIRNAAPGAVPLSKPKVVA